MIVYQRKNGRKHSKTMADRYLTREERKALAWYEARRAQKTNQPMVTMEKTNNMPYSIIELLNLAYKKGLFPIAEE